MENEHFRYINSFKLLSKNNLNLNIKRYIAIIGKNVNRLDHIISKRDLSKYSNGQIGCLLSHLYLIKYFVDFCVNDYILICEDDVEVFNPHNLNIYQIIDNAPKNWHTIRLSYIVDPEFYKKIETNKNNYLSQEYSLWSMGTASYLISRKGANYLINKFWNINEKKWDFENLIIMLEEKLGDDRFPIDKWMFSTNDDYIFKYPIFTYNYIVNSTTSTNINETTWSNNSKKYICDIITLKKLFKPKISIILPTYNGIHKLIKTLPSIIEQTFKNFELIIIVDGSTDDTYNFLKKNYNYKNIHIVYQDNKKLPKSLNEGLIRCRGKYITWTSDDNFLKKNFLSKFYEYMKLNKNVSFAYSGFNVFGDDNWVFDKKISNVDMFFRYPGLPSFMWTKSVINKIGFYDQRLLGIEDYDYILRTMEINPYFGFVDDILYDYLFENNGNNMTSDIYKNNKINLLNHKLLHTIILRNNGLPTIDIFFPNEKDNFNKETLYKSLNEEMKNCKKEGYTDFFIHNNLLFIC
jgi:glycosyltransferase involved in cell wall biosynthesis/GR25 family glycosyltransferase involved in LPS biosynthesis